MAARPRAAWQSRTLVYWRLKYPRLEKRETWGTPSDLICQHSKNTALYIARCWPAALTGKNIAITLTTRPWGSSECNCLFSTVMAGAVMITQAAAPSAQPFVDAIYDRTLPSSPPPWISGVYGQASIQGNVRLDCYGGDLGWRLSFARRFVVLLAPEPTACDHQLCSCDACCSCSRSRTWAFYVVGQEQCRLDNAPSAKIGEA